MADARPIVIAHISDLHCGSSYFIPSLAMRVVDELNEMAPDVVVVTGDLTDMGFAAEFKTARRLIDEIACERKVVLIGNHDARNVGEVPVSYTHLRAHETRHDLVCRLLLEKKKK